MEPVGLLGGIWLFWKAGFVQVDIIEADRYFIHASVLLARKTHINLTLVYASTLGVARNTMWDNILNLQVDHSQAWYVLGDFNDIASLSDQQGGSSLYISRSINHQRQINAVNLIDMGASGHKFTWRRNRLQVRLDRVYSNSSARCIFANAIVVNLPFQHSDHCPVLLNIGAQNMIYLINLFGMKWPGKLMLVLVNLLKIHGIHSPIFSWQNQILRGKW